MKLEYMLNNIITSGLEPVEPDVLRKYKVLNIFQISIMILAPLSGLFYFYIGAVHLFYTCVVTGILMVIGILLLRMTKNLVLSGNYALFVLWAAISIISWETGATSFDGLISPSWILNAGLILLAIFLNGYLSGTVWAIVIFIQTGVIIFLFRKGYQFESVIPPELTATYFMGIYMVCLLAILLFAFLFEKEKSDALTRDQSKAQTIREAKKYMDNIFDMYPLPTFVLDRRHRVIQWNRACREISGLSTEEVLGKEVWEGFHMSNERRSMADILIEDTDSISDLYKEEIISYDRGWFELNTYLPGLNNGTRATITAATILDGNGVVRGAIQTVQELRDMPVQVGIQDYLSDSFVKAVFKVDAKGKISFWNSACTELFGYDLNGMIGQSPLGIVAKNYRPLFKKIFLKVVNGVSFSSQELKFISAEDNPVYVMAGIFSCRNAENDAVEYVFINTDITQLQLKLDKLRQVASESNEKYKGLSEEFLLLKKNIASFVRKK